MQNKILLVLILVIALLVRVINLDTFTPGVYIDEASMAYDAYSLGLTGADQWGKSWPIYFRSFATYQAPLYVYLSVFPIKVLGMTTLGIRLVSLLSGIFTTVLVYYLFKLAVPDIGEKIGLFSALVLSISPWHILFSRNALEANLGLFILVLSLYLLFVGVYKKSKVSILAGIITLGITNYAYHSYRFTSIIIAWVFLLFYWKEMTPALRKTYLIGLLLFCLLLIPQLMILTSAGSLRRLSSTQYSGKSYFQEYGGEFKNVAFGRYLFFTRDFLKKYFDYLSPNSIFFDSDPAATKGISEMGSFYSWMLLLYALGAVKIFYKYRNKFFIFFISLGFISLIPAAVTTDNLYLLRALGYLLVISVVIGVGLMKTSSLIKNKYLKLLFLSVVILASLLHLYVNYFHISSHERKADYSGTVNELFYFTKQHTGSSFVVSLSKPFSYIIALYAYQYDPKRFQEEIKFNTDKYYEDLQMPAEYSIANINIRNINWQLDTCQEQYLVGDELTAPEVRVKNHNLILVNKLRADLEEGYIGIYKTNPQVECKVN